MLFEQASAVVVVEEEDDDDTEVTVFVDREEERLGELLNDSDFWENRLVERDCFSEF